MNKILVEDFENILNSFDHIDYFREKKVLITGATGFLGGYLAKYLIYLKSQKKVNIEIYCTYRNYPRLKNKFNQIELGHLKLVKTDLSKPIKKKNYDYVFHAASIATPKLFNEFPIEVIEPNIFGLNNLLKSIEIKTLSRFVLFSTTGVGGFVDELLRPNKENVYGPLDCADITNCYLESKRMAEMICMAWFHERALPICIIRPSITYGPGIELDDGRSYADFVKNIVCCENIELNSDGGALRNFLYVSDFLRGLLLATTKSVNGEVYNIASPKEISILELCNKLVNEVFEERSLKVVRIKNPIKKYMRINFRTTTVDVNKISKLGWHEITKIDDGFKRTVNYYEDLNKSNCRRE